ncbi:MAG: hypothetical protein IJP78_05360 [Clostridia bacterium]|nr:hypothetical protein [Clostridia bacterium]
MLTNATGNERKALVKAIAAHIGEKEKYLGVPSCAYSVGPFTIARDGAIDFAGDTDQELIRKLCDALAEVGLSGAMQDSAEANQDSKEAEAEDTAQTAVKTAQEAEDAPTEPEHPDEPDTLTVSLPMAGHTGISLRNLVSMIYSRGKLISKATGGEFSCTEELTIALKDDTCLLTTESLCRAIANFEAENGKALTGLSFTEDKVTFTFPMTEDAEILQAFQQLACQMCRLAKEQKRTLAKTVDTTNEKYIFRIWLLALGMGGDEFKTARRVLLSPLSGSAAFKDQAMEDRWKEKQAAKRDAAKAVANRDTLAENETE